MIITKCPEVVFLIMLDIRYMGKQLETSSLAGNELVPEFWPSLTLFCYLTAFLDSVEADGHVVHVEDELAQVAEEETEDHQDQNPGQVCFAFTLSVRLKELKAK